MFLGSNQIPCAPISTGHSSGAHSNGGWQLPASIWCNLSCNMKYSCRFLTITLGSKRRCNLLEIFQEKLIEGVNIMDHKALVDGKS